MTDASGAHLEPHHLPEGDVVRVLLEQHAQVRRLFAEVAAAEGEARRQAFGRLRMLLAVHETAEEMVLRPVTKATGGDRVADARNQEEAEANQVLKDLERLDTGSGEFTTSLAVFEQAVLEHAANEETQEFPHILAQCGESRRVAMGRLLRAAEAVAPTHPHPSTAGSIAAQWAAGPLVSVVDRVRDAIRKARG